MNFKGFFSVLTVVTVIGFGVSVHADMGGGLDSGMGTGSDFSEMDPGTGGFMNNDMGNFRGASGSQRYGSFQVDTSMDVFTNPGRFMEVSGGMEFVDENGDGMVDVVQNTPLYESMGFGPWADGNSDGIGDMFQSREMYESLGMGNFVDVDGDGLCDNYELSPMGGFMGEGMGNFRGASGEMFYPEFEVDTGNDVFTNPARFREVSGGMEFVDENGDGMVDVVQNTEWYQSMGFGQWMDENTDGIGDMFQTREMYESLGMGNFVDVDGDGLCDNYELSPMGSVM